MSRAAPTGYGIALVSACSFGLSGPFAAALTRAGWSADGAVLVRLGGAAAVLLVLLAVRRPGLAAALRLDGPAIVLYGVLAMAGVQVAFFHALQYLPVAVALLLEYAAPVLVIAWVWLVRRRPPGPRTLLGAAIAIGGLLLVVQVWSAGVVAPAGLAWGFGAAVYQAAYFLMADRAARATPPLVLAGAGMTVGALVVGLLGLAGATPVVVDVRATGVVLAGADVGWPAVAVLLVLVSTVLAYLSGIVAIERIGAARASLVALLEVLVSALASWLLLGQVPAPVQLAGGALVLAGVALTVQVSRTT